MEKLSNKARMYARSYGQPPYGREIKGTAELLLQMADKLEEYEDLEEQGKLMKLPCAVGDTVYAYCSRFGILQYEIDNIVIGRDITYQCSSYSEPIGDCPSEWLDEIEPVISDFGKTIFLTQKEAEAVLKNGVYQI